MSDINIVITSSNWTARDLEIIFGDEDVAFTENTQLEHILKEFSVYKSTSEARRVGRHGLIAKGYSEVKASKLVKLFIWNPSDD